MKTTMILAALLLTACATTGQMNSISPGMTKQEVVSVLGRPDSTSSDGRVEYMRYSLLKIGYGQVEHFVRVIDGKVDAYGRVGDFGTSTPTVNVNLGSQ